MKRLESQQNFVFTKDKTFLIIQVLKCFEIVSLFLV